MPEYYNNILCISKPELTDCNPPILTSAAYDQYVYRHPYVRVRRGSPAGPALLNWDLVRADIRRKYISVHGDPRSIGPRYSLKNLVEPDYKAIAFFATYEIADNINLKPEKQQEYSTNASVLNALNTVVNDKKALRKALGNKTKLSWSDLAEAVSELKDSLKHTLPENPIRLKQRLAMYKGNGYASLISGKFLNRNASLVVDPQQEATMRQLLRKHNNFDNEQISSIYNTIAESLGWDKVSGPTVGNYRERWGLETFSGRHGSNAWDNQKAMLVKRSIPTQPLYYWTADGWEAELLYQKTEVSDNGATRTTYHNRLTLVVVLDPSHKYPIGYAIGTHETPELIKAALRNAIQHTKELFGEHYKVLQLQTDNYSKKKLTPIYEAISGLYTPARVQNAKAKVIEPYFRYLNKNYFQFLYNWSGFGVTARPSSQPSSQYLNKTRSSFPDEAGCRHQIASIMEMERAKKREKYIAAFAKMPEEDKHIIQYTEYLSLLGETTGYTNRLSASGLVVTIDGVKREYDTFDVNFRRNANVDWVVKYEPGNTQRVLACSQDGTLRFELQEKYVQPMALRDRQPGDSKELMKIRGFNENLKGKILESMQRDYNTVEDVFKNNPQLEGTLAKLILVDSNGQHKDNKSAARLGAARKVLARQNKRIEAMEEKSWAAQQEEYLDSKVDISKFLNQ